MGRFILKKTIILVVFLTLICGCASIQEPFKTFWGSSTRALEKTKQNGQAKEFNCLYNDCFEKTVKVLAQVHFNIFLKDKPQHRIVVMNVKNSIDTTEVGIFFTELGNNKVKIEISSLSPRAVDAVASDLFPGLERLLTTH